MLGTQNGTADYEATGRTPDGSSIASKEAETIEQLRGELATLENRIRQAAVQAESERVSFLFPSDDLEHVMLLNFPRSQKYCHECLVLRSILTVFPACWFCQPSSNGYLTRMSYTSNTNLTTGFSEDDIDDSEVTGAYGDVFGKSIEKLKDASSVSSLHATFLNTI